MELINILDILNQEVEGISLTDAMRISHRIMDRHAAAIEDSPVSFLYQGLKWTHEIDRLIRENNGKIPAIKEVRRINSPQPGGGSLSLLTAKNAVDARERQITY